VMDAAPEILLIAQCGYSAQQASDEYRRMSFPEEWNAIPAVRNSRVYAMDASGYFSRPGPRLISGIEALAKILHPEVVVSPEAESVTLPIQVNPVTAFPSSLRASA
jgi:iron complex transport system substrate-binding protein